MLTQNVVLENKTVLINMIGTVFLYKKSIFSPYKSLVLHLRGAFARKIFEHPIKSSNALKSAIHRYFRKRLVGSSYKIFGKVASVLIYERIKVYSKSFVENSRNVFVVVSNCR